MDLRKIKDKATEAFAKGRFAKAAELYEEYCKGDPKDLQARLRMGDAFAKSGQKEKAVLAYKSAAEGYAREGFLPRAIAASKLILEIDPTHKGVQQMLADLYARKSTPGGGDGRKPAGRTPPEPVDSAASALDWSKRRDAIELSPVDEPSPTNRKDAIELSPVDGPRPTNRKNAIELPPLDEPSPASRTRAIELSPVDVPSPLNRKDAIELPPEPSPGPVEQGVPIEIEHGPAADGAVELEVPIEAAPKELSLETTRAQPVNLSAELPPELQIDVTAPPGRAEAATQPVPPKSRTEPEPLPTIVVDPSLFEAASQVVDGASPKSTPARASADPSGAAAAFGKFELRGMQSASNVTAGLGAPPSTGGRPGAASSGTLAAPSGLTSAGNIGGARPGAVPADVVGGAAAPGAPSLGGGHAGAVAPAGAAAPSGLTSAGDVGGARPGAVPADASAAAAAQRSAPSPGAASLIERPGATAAPTAGAAPVGAPSPSSTAFGALGAAATSTAGGLIPAMAASLRQAPASHEGTAPVAPTVSQRDAASTASSASATAAPSDAAPPGLKPKRHADAAAPPPEHVVTSTTEPARPGEPVELPTRRKPERPAAAQRTASRIWIPPAFPGAPQEPPAEHPKETPAAALQEVPRGFRTDLERGLAAFSRFDELEIDLEKAAALAPLETGGVPSAPEEPPKPPPKRVPSFTELELEGDSLLHAVETAALAGAAQRGQQVDLADEALDAPEELTDKPAGELPKIPLFSDLPADAFIALFEQCPLRRFNSGERVIEQGTLGDSFFVICQGSVRVYRYEAGSKRQLAILPEGSFFGEMALLSGAPRSASVEAAEDETQLLEISAPVLQQLSLKYPTVAQALKKFCRQRMLSNVMASSALFKPFNRADRKQLVQRFRARDVPKNEVIIREGDRSDGLYVVLSGEVEVRKGQTRLAVLKEGDIFGEMSLLTKSPASATVASLKHTSLLRLPREDFDLIISSHPQILVLVSELTDDRKRKNELQMV